MTAQWTRRIAAISLFISIAWCAGVAAAEEQGPVHGLWVWKSPEVLNAAQGAERLRDFCKSQGINEVYVSFSAASAPSEGSDFTHLIGLLHGAKIRVEALLSSTDADEAGAYRDKLLDRVDQVIGFNRSHAEHRFDGIHLDIEPQHRAENKGPGNLKFLPGLADAFRAVSAKAQSAGLTVNADIQNKLLKGDVSERRMLLSAVPRVTLMMYELSNPDDGQTPEQKTEKAAEASKRFLDMAYDGLTGRELAGIAIALRTPDYGGRIQQVLARLDEANRGNPHYLGWARHCYNDVLESH